MKILGIETSCDETAAAVYDNKKGLLSSIVASQIDIHKKTGGVVPEVASRAHVEQITPVIDEALEKAKTKAGDIDLIAVTHAPGLIGSLLVGVNTAKTLSFVWDKPLMPINHIEAHIYANFIGEIPNPKSQITNKSQIPNPKDLKNPKDPNNPNFQFPAVILIVSGGHTSLVLMRDHGKYKTLGETLDDAAGEAFDKVAKVFDLPYPGGPEISRAAEEYRRKFSIFNFQFSNKSQIPNPKNLKSPESLNNPNLQFPRSMLDSGDFNFSFSGLKTAVLYKWQEVTSDNETMKQLNNLRTKFAFEFQEAVVDILSSKTIEAAKKYKAKTISICGGVAANKRLRGELEKRIQEEALNTKYLIPNTKYCGDNAAMVACCAVYRVKKKSLNKYRDLDFREKSKRSHEIFL